VATEAIDKANNLLSESKHFYFYYAAVVRTKISIIYFGLLWFASLHACDMLYLIIGITSESQVEDCPRTWWTPNGGSTTRTT
jgi:hypothetical protein